MAATKKGSTKPVTIDWEMVRKMATMHCSVRGVSAVLGVNEETMRKHCQREYGMPPGEWFAIQSERGMCKVRYQLAKAQISLAIKDKNPTMLIWLGKQYLGQSDKGALEINSTVTLQNEVSKMTDAEIIAAIHSIAAGKGEPEGDGHATH